MTYELTIERRAQKALARISKSERNRIIEAVRDLASDPRPAGVKKLSGREGWRIRVGSYRVLYEIYDNKLLVLIISIGHRREAYRR